MVKGTIRQTIGAAAIAALLPLLCVSCSDDGISTASIDGDMVTVGITVQASYGYDEDGKYETGSGYENYIDIDGGDYRIYFFEATAADGNDKLITTFTPQNVVPMENTEYTEYTMWGKVPDEIIPTNGNTSNFKVVMLANWGVDNYPEVTNGTTTISQICSDKKFLAFVNTDDEEATALLPDADRLIPFFGVNTYTGVTFKTNDVTVLDGPITLLRAMAKVEVILQDETYTEFDAVRMHRYNKEGYCAPEKVYDRSDYDSNYADWEKDFWQEVHLVNDGNDKDGDDPEEKSFLFYKTQGYEENTTYETWVAYVPEYDNNSSNKDDYAYIEVVLKGMPYYIYFANYDDSGNTGAYDADNTDYSDRYDIHRNNLYRFTVSMGEQTLKVHVIKWDEEYENEFEFGEIVTGGTSTEG